MRFGLLGSLLVRNGEDDCTIRGAKARALLAVLLLNAGRPVFLDRLIDTLWDGQAPATAEASLRNLVSRLRRTLADPDGQRLRAVPSGYQLMVEDQELDTQRFELAVRRAHSAQQAGDLAGVLAETAAALELWRGEPLADLPELAACSAACAQWRESRLLALEWRFDAELRLGRPHGPLAELTRLVDEHPLREAFHAQLMDALDRTGQRARALEVHQRLRTALVEELGVEPGPAVQESHRRILADPPGSEPAARPVPAQLPSPPTHFLGRDDQISALRATLTAAADRTAVAVVSGLAGVGKSALAVHCAHTLRAGFPDGQLFLNLRGATPGLTPIDPQTALVTLLRTLGFAPSALPEDIEGAAALLRSTLAGTRTLLLLDDAADLAQVRPLLPSTPGCAVLITSRSPLLALDAALHLRLDTLSEREGIALVERTAGRATADRTVVALEQADLARLVQLCGRLPLALRIVGARLAARRTMPVRKLVGRLEGPEDRLDELELDDLSIRRSLGITYDSLRASDRRPDRRAAAALVAVGALDLPEYSAPLLAGVLRISPAQAAGALDRLTEVALLEEVRPDRFAPHDLVRDYARELADPAEHDRLVRAALHWYLDTISRAAFTLDPQMHERRRLHPLDPAAELPDHATALALGDAECGNLLVLVERLADEPWAAGELLLLERAVYVHLRLRGRNQELARLSDLALRVARREGDLFAEGIALSDRAHMHFVAGRNLLALDLIHRCEEIWHRLGAWDWEIRTMSNRGMLLSSLDRKAEALEILERVRDLSARRGDTAAEATVLSALGNLVEASDPHLAISYHQRSIDLGRLIGHTETEAAGLDNIGYAHLRLGDPGEALSYFESVIALSTSSGSRESELQARKGRVEALRRLNRLDEALAACHDLLAWTSTLQGTYGTGLAGHLHGLILRDLGRRAEAVAAWQFALTRLTGAQVPEVAELHALLATAETA